jgi:drug/metabolite transporter (DMT)-like permease
MPRVAVRFRPPLRTGAAALGLSLEARITLLVLLAAFLHACWNALVKAGRDPLLTISTVSAVTCLISAALLPFVAPPARAAWPYIAAGVLAHNGFKVFLILSYRLGDLSRVYPLARGSAPLVVAAFAGLAAGEVLHGGELAGVALISAGLASLALEPRRAGRADLLGVVFALLTGAFIGAYTLIDGIGVRLSGSFLGYSAWLFFCDGIPMVAMALWFRGRHLRAFFRGGVAPALAAGTLSLFAYFVVVWALQQGAMAPIAALRETGVIFATLIGRVVLKEPFGWRRAGAAALVTAGVAALHLGG